MRTVSVLSWSGWSPGLETHDAWRAWAESPAPLAPSGHPDAKFLPAMLRRRCSPLTRIILTAAWGCVEEGMLGNVRTVFASRHGSVNESIEMLSKIVQGERLSPAKFSHTVHNAQAGLYCIAAGNRQASSSLAAREDTFACGWLEALTHLEREPERPVLYAMGDVELAPAFAELVEEPASSYALAFLLARNANEHATTLRLDVAGSDPAPSTPWPHAGEFLRWLLGSEAALSLGRYRWSRD
jgi:hypothetical protein